MARYLLRLNTVAKDGKTLAHELNRKFLQQAQSRMGVGAGHVTHIEHLIGER